MGKMGQKGLKLLAHFCYIFLSTSIYLYIRDSLYKGECNVFNVTVISVKDIIKYTTKIAIAAILLFLFIKVLSKNFNFENSKIELSSIIKEEKLLQLIQENIPVIKQINKEEKVEDVVEKINPLKTIVASQLNVANYIKPKEEKEQVNQSAGKNKEEQKEKTTVNRLKVEQAQTGLSTEVLPSSVPNKYTNSYNGVQVRNETDYQLTEEMLTPNITVDNKSVLIFHTHTCESYTPSENFSYEQTGTYRTTDLNYSVARVGEELTSQLNSYGYKVIHNTTYHDWPAYSGSYGRSLETVKKLLQENKDTDVVIDLHRDAIGDYSYAPTVKIGEEEASQLMFVIGTDGGGLEHPNWNENLKFAVKVQEKANELYPGLFKPIILRNSRYNQHLSKAACIIEVGATGNTMEQCLNSMKYLAKVMNEVMK